jgi:hypothetical protein
LIQAGGEIGGSSKCSWVPLHAVAIGVGSVQRRLGVAEVLGDQASLSSRDSSVRAIQMKTTCSRIGPLAMVATEEKDAMN